MGQADRSRRASEADRQQQLRGLALGGAVVGLVVGLGVCWALTAPSSPAATAVPTAVALGAAVLLVGLGLLPTVGAEPSTRIVGIAGAVGAIAALVAMWLRTADQVGASATTVSVEQFLAVASGGAPELLVGVAAFLALVWAGVAEFSSVVPPTAAVAILGGIAVLAMSVSGHAGTHRWAPIVVAVHALAAAWWCGLLAAMALSLRGRSGWAAALPEFSGRALWAVAALTITGIVAAAVEINRLADLVDSGYGRVLLAKTLLLIGVLVLAWWHRRSWLPGAARHRISEAVSLRRASIEVVLLTVVLGLAAGLSGTPPP